MCTGTHYLDVYLQVKSMGILLWELFTEQLFRPNIPMAASEVVEWKIQYVEGAQLPADSPEAEFQRQVVLGFRPFLPLYGNPFEIGL